jgi:translation initiation factor 3 subunit M
LYEEEQAVELAKYVEGLKGEGAAAEEEAAEKPLSPYVQKVSGLNDAGEYAPLLDIFLTDIETVFAKGTESDVAGAYSIMYALCRKMPEAVQATYTQKLIETTAQETTTTPELRLKMLVNLYNSVHPNFGKMRHSVFMALIDYCVATSQVAKVAKHIGNLQGRVQTWGLSPAQQKELYLKLAEALQDYQNGELAQKFLVTFLSLWGAKDNYAQAAPQAIAAAVKAIQNPTTFSCDELLRTPAVAALKTGDEKAQAVHRLLEIYSREKLEDYEKFVANKGAIVASIGLDHDTCVDKLRMLSLASLATEMTEIPYDTIKEILKLDKDKDVELWVIKVHRAGLVQGKMDQIRRVVIVNRTTARVFSTTDWAELRTRVDGWRQCLTNMSDIIQGAKESAELA